MRSELFRLGAGMRRRARVGVLGGSFNPAHAGHRAVGLRALRELRLDRVWWLVSPQNPLKPARGMAPLARRLAEARRVGRHPRIRVGAFELALGTRYAADTAAALRRRWPRARFVWLIGADNFAQLPEWRRWTALLRALPLAVFDRAPYSARALRGAVAARFARFRRGARGLADAAPPAWAFLRGRPHPESATRLRRAAATNEQGTGEPAISDDKPTAWAETVRRIALGSLRDDKAADVTVIDLAGKTTIADFMIVASGRSERHVAAAAQHLAERLKKRGMPPRSIEGLPKADWVLVDAGDVIVHIFRPEVREYYNLEKMWAQPLPDPAGAARAPETAGLEAGAPEPAGRDAGSA